VTHTVIIGAGLAGLAAAQRLVGQRTITVLDKGRGVGGRMATRRIGAATLDHGAQFFTVRSDEFAALVEPLRHEGLIAEWCKGFRSPEDGYPRFMVRGGMSAWPKRWASGLDVRCDTLAFSITRRASGWRVTIDDGSMVDADEVVLTCPIPQSFSLMITADIEVPETLWRTDYDRTLCLLATVDGTTAIAEPGGLQDATGWTFVADNLRKGVSAAPAVTLHADPAWSEAHWDDEPAAALTAIIDRAAPLLGDATIVEAQLKKWRYATPRAIWPDRCWFAADHPTLVMAGDAFGGPRVEGAVLSGVAAAEHLLG
jgi:renalase